MEQMSSIHIRISEGHTKYYAVGGMMMQQYSVGGDHKKYEKGYNNDWKQHKQRNSWWCRSTHHKWTNQKNANNDQKYQN